MGHTREPWGYRLDDVGYALLIDNRQDSIIDGWGPADKIERIVTCVNAMAGLSNDEVERYGPLMKDMFILIRDIAVAKDSTHLNPAGIMRLANVLLSRIKGKESA